MIQNLLQDLRYALRTLRRSPGFTMTAILALALGIGANVAIFSVVNTVLLQPLSYPEPDRLVQLMRQYPDGIGDSTSVPKFMIWRQQTRVFQDIAVYDFAGPGINITGGDRPEQVKGIRVSAGYFRVFGAPVSLGRTFTDEEDQPGGPKLAVIGNGLWHRRFGADPLIIGKRILLGDEPYLVVGVLGADFHTDPRADLWLPLQADPNSDDHAHYLRCAARLRPGVSLGQAKAAMKISAEEFRNKFHKWIDDKESATAEPLRDFVVRDVRSALFILLGAVGFVLLIACANVANLLLTRGTLRGREIALRTALGARRSRLIAQLLTESVLLSLMGGLLGLTLGFFGVRALLAINPGNIPRIGEHGAAIALDWRLFVFALGVSVLTGVLFGLVPALVTTRTNLSATLKESGHQSSSGARHNKARSMFVVTEIALALILLVGATLLIRTFAALRGVDPGFNPHKILTMQMSLTGKRFEKAAGNAQLVNEAELRLNNLPGVESAAATFSLPLEQGFDLPFTIASQPPKDGPYNGDSQWRGVSSGYFSVFGIPVLRGRVFTDKDQAAAAHVVVINAAMAKEYWPKGDPLGDVLTIGKGLGPEFEEPGRQVIGIVGDVRDTGLNRDPEPIMYVPLAQINDGMTALGNHLVPLTWAIRTKVQPYSLDSAIEAELRSASGGLPVSNVRSMDQVVVESTARANFNMTLLSIFAGVALLLAAIGIYGLMAYSVQQRQQEIGIRMALGASPENIRRMVVGQGVRIALIGVLIGTISAIGLTRLMASLLFGIKAWDPVTLVSVAAGLSAIALLATYLPAHRASRVHPMVSLRCE